MKKTKVYDTYWQFAHERQEIFFKRLRGLSAPWSNDPVLIEYKFTNAYRASDRVSQFLIRNVIYRDDLPDEPSEVVFRVLLFKIFNKIETWQLLERELGPLLYSAFNFKRYDDVLTQAMQAGTRIYSGAYIMPSAGSYGHIKKHRNHLCLIGQMLTTELPKRLIDARSLQDAFQLIRAYPTIGDFLAYQYIIDINYSPVVNFQETEFVVAGPGAIDGMRKCFDDFCGKKNDEIIRMMMDNQDKEFERLGLKFQSLFGRPLQLIDCQNIFCEVDKYSRVVHPDVSGVTGRTRIKQKFKQHEIPVEYWFPPKWYINNKVASAQASVNSLVLELK